MPASVTIRNGSLEEVVSLSKKIPEFVDPHGIEEYKKRLDNKPYLILIAEIDGQPAGFKVGYEKENDGSFYSWMGAILPEFRKKGIAQRLADFQENWAKEQGYSYIRFKTRNNLKSMLIFSIKNGFDIVAVETRHNIKEYRITLQKELHD